MVWGSDWPHPGLAFDHKPDDALLFDLLSEWAPNEADRHRILVENPETVYGFPKLA
jgi:predicted TIM-barrel fold metal-dependent hydrolase